MSTDHTPKNSRAGIAKMLQTVEEWKGLLGFDTFQYEIVKLRRPPYRGGDVGELTDADVDSMAIWIENRYGFEPRLSSIWSAINHVTRENAFHPPRDYVLSKPWDKIERAEQWLIECGAPDTEYVRLVSRKFLIGAVARIFDPGCKMDNTLILEGRQGTAKSQIVGSLVPCEWYSQHRQCLTNKDADMALDGTWIAEFSELASFKKLAVHDLKDFLSDSSPKYRRPYEKKARRVPRQCVFIGTTNEYEYLEDNTGNRRFWPVRITATPDSDAIKWLLANRQQLWAEAYQGYLNKEEYWTKADHPLVVAEQEKRLVISAREEEYQQILTNADLNSLLAKGFLPSSRIFSEALNLGRKPFDEEAKDLRKVMERMGWTYGRPMINGARLRGYYPPKDDLAVTCKNATDDSGQEKNERG